MPGGDLELAREESDRLCADAFTKPLDAETLNRHLQEMGFIEVGDSSDEDDGETTGLIGAQDEAKRWEPAGE